MLVGVQVLLQLQMKQIKLIATEATLAVDGTRGNSNCSAAGQLHHG